MTSTLDDARGELLALADEYEAGLKKMEASGYEEFDGPRRTHRIVIDALRAQARAAPARCDAVNANALQNAFDLGFRAAGGSCHLPPSVEAFFQSWLRDGSSHARREREEEIPPALSPDHGTVAVASTDRGAP